LKTILSININKMVKEYLKLSQGRSVSTSQIKTYLEGGALVVSG